ncbi:MAG: hypothetical protein DCC68_04485 [Planctomycetota bacterium]|nr:MAG: hypothetical protein DCC68_04485 [Planctomycetota bacterium]
MSDAQPRLDLGPSRQLAAALADWCGRDRARLAEVLAAADARLGQHDKSFGGLKNLSVALSALLLDAADVAALRQTAERLFAIVDRVVGWILASPERSERLAGDYRRIFPYLAKTPGARYWQAISRYDAVVAEDGRIRIIELNTGCPAGFMHAAAFTKTTGTALGELGVLGDAARMPATIRATALVDGLIEIERAATAAGSVEPGLAVLLTDENRLTHELDLMLDDFASRGRIARIAPAEELAFDGRRATHRGQPISLTYDKFRISVPTSRNHCWRDGFDVRYAAFLAAQKAGAFAAVNNLAAQSIAEDKSLLGILALPETAELMSEAERQFVADNVLWTARLQPGRVVRDGAEIDLLAYVAGHQDEFVIKPTSEGRGYGVVIGRECPRDEWQTLCAVDPATPRVVQDYVEPAKLSVVCDGDSGLAVREMYLTLGLATVNGRYEGVLSRISPSRITNVARQGFVQAVLANS